jgi:phage terminase small subunit
LEDIQMAGKSGRSGGARVGAGRPAKPPAKLKDSDLLMKALQQGNPKAFLLAVMADSDNDARLRVDAAKALLPYEFQKVADSGKKEEQLAAVQRVMKGRFAPGKPPTFATVTKLLDW